MTSFAAKAGKCLGLIVNVPKWPLLLQFVFPRASRSELTCSLIILGLIAAIAVIAIKLLHELPVAKLMTFT